MDDLKRKIAQAGRANSRVCSWRREQLLRAYLGEIPRGSRILDVGSGSGAIGKAVADTFQAIVEGADIENFLAYDLPFHFLPQDWQKWPGGSFDTVMINDALHHMKPDIQVSTLREALRVGKKVMIFETAPTLLAKILDVVMGNFIFRGREAIPLTHKDIKAWNDILESLGGEVSARDLPKPFFLYPLRHFVIISRLKR